MIFFSIPSLIKLSFTTSTHEILKDKEEKNWERDKNIAKSTTLLGSIFVACH